ncbi:hypothetical protein [Streptomyces achromogenes]|uniref:hypothetical protein n=1 Tax=Streptomyces achromogenes TaxID=67255 RepID=UPI0004C7D834|nr:hypothetical protein [Streptomyces achromogenes]
MPMIDVFVPEGALTQQAEQDLINKITRAMIRFEGLDPDDPEAQAVTWAFLHHAAVFVGGTPATAPHYRVLVCLPEGLVTNARVQEVVTAITDMVLAAEQGAWDRDPSRVWVLPLDVPEGRWGAGGRIVDLREVVLFARGGDERTANRVAREWLSASRSERYAAPPA